MTNRSKRLELTWIGKEERPRLEPRILPEDQELSYAKRVSGDDIFDNRLIHGDNLLALKALEQEFAGWHTLLGKNYAHGLGLLKQAEAAFNAGMSYWLASPRSGRGGTRVGG